MHPTVSYHHGDEPAVQVDILEPHHDGDHDYPRPPRVKPSQPLAEDTRLDCGGKASNNQLEVQETMTQDRGTPAYDWESEPKHDDQAPGCSTGTATWSRGKNLKCAQAGTTSATTSNTPTDQLHRTLRGHGGLKPKRRLNRDYRQPGKFRGVRYRGKGRYSAELKVKEERRWLGIFTTAEEAARAFDKAAFEVRGRAARLNFPELIEGADVNHWLHRPSNAGVMMDRYSEREDGRVDDDIHWDASTLSYHGRSANRGDARCPPWRRITQHVNFPSRHPKAESNTCGCGVRHTMACGHTVTCTSTSPFPPTSRIPRPGSHTHPLTARPSPWSDLDADPLSLHPPMLPAPDVVNMCSRRGADTSPRAEGVAMARSNHLLGCRSSSSSTCNRHPIDPTNGHGFGTMFRFVSLEILKQDIVAVELQMQLINN